MARIALFAKGISYETSMVHSSPEDGGRIEAPSEKSIMNTPMQRKTPTLVVNGCSSVVHISGLNLIFNFLKSSFPDCDSRLLPPDPEAQARAREVAKAINSVIWNGGTTLLISMHDVEDKLSSLKASLAPYAAVGRPFAIGMHGPNITEICLIPICTMHGDTGLIWALTPH
jgi:hypothetical protein